VVLRTVAVVGVAVAAAFGFGSTGRSSSGTEARDRQLAVAMAFVARRCPKETREISTSQWMRGQRFNALYGNCLAGDGRDQHVWFFLGSRFIGADTREPFASKEIIGLWRDDTTIAFMYVLYRRRDPNCCPTGGGKIVRFRLIRNHVVALDRLPKNR
jgi:hypothetical protein